MVEFEKRLACVIKADGTIIRGLRPFLSAFLLRKCDV
jgi:hypothetical protein